MRRLLAALGLATVGAAAFSWKRLRCLWVGHKNVRRTRTWFECFDCGKRASDLGAFRTMDSGFVRGRRFM